MGLLDGVRVVEHVAFVAAPLAGLTMAQMGADVVRVDPIGGAQDRHRWPVAANGESLYWAGLNKGKRSVALDLRQKEGRAVLHALATAPGPDAGIYTTNLGLRGEMSFDALCRSRPDMIVASLSGSHDGSIAVDYTVNAATGLPFMTGPIDRAAPVNHVFPAWDMGAGYQLATGILAALRWRDRTGQGQLVELALADVAFAMMSHLGFLADAELTGQDRPRFGNHVYGTFGCDFATSDGRRLMLVVVTDRQWRALGETLGLAGDFAALEAAKGLDLRREGDRHHARDEIAALVAPWVAARTLDEAAAILDAAGALWGPYRTTTELLAHDPRASTANPMFSVLHQPGIEPHRAAGSALAFGAAPRAPATPAPALGQHTVEVLGERLGYGAGRIAELRDAGVINAPA